MGLGHNLDIGQGEKRNQNLNPILIGSLVTLAPLRQRFTSFMVSEVLFGKYGEVRRDIEKSLLETAAAAAAVVVVGNVTLD